MAKRMTSLPSTNSTFIDITTSELTESDVLCSLRLPSEHREYTPGFAN
jgi:hypothetical protein